MPASATNQIARLIFNALQESPHAAPLVHLSSGKPDRLVELSAAGISEGAVSAARILDSLVSETRSLFLCFPAGPEFAIALLGCIVAGITAIPLPVPRTNAEVKRLVGILADNGPHPIVTSSVGHRRLHEAISTTGHEPAIFILPGLPTLERTASDRSHDRLQECFVPFGSRPVIVQYTSGSTAEPKGVALAEQAIIANYRLASKRWHFEPHKTMCSWLPHFHDMGLFGGILFPLMAGMRAVVMRPEDFIKRPIRWLHAVQSFGAHISGAPAFAYRLCLESISDEQLSCMDLSQWESAYCGADYVPAQLLDEVRLRFGLAGLSPRAVLSCYGLAENVLFVAGERTPDNDAVVFSNRNSSRTRCEGCYLGESASTIRIVPYREEPDDEPETFGRIQISGDCLASDYTSGPLNKVEEAGRHWFDTGDLGFIENGYLFVTGRDSNLIVVNGRNVSSDDVAISASAACTELNAQACVVIQTFPEPTSELTLLIELRSKSTARDQMSTLTIRSRILEDTGVNVNQVLILPRGALPRTSSGKVRALLARKLFLEA